MEKKADTSVGSGTDRRPQTGDQVYHDGSRDFYIMRFGVPPRQQLCQFENQDRKVTCLVADLVYSKDRGAWYLPGRVFPRDIRMNQRSMGLDDRAVEKDFMGT